MVAMALLVAFSQTSRPISGDACANRVKSLLEGFRVPKPLRVYKADQVRYGRFSGWHIELTNARKSHYVADLDLSGRVTRLIRARGGHGRGGHIRKLTDPRYARTVRNWLSMLGGDRQVRLDSIVADGNHIGYARYSILRNGHPFVAQPQYGYVFTFTVPEGEFLGLTAREGPPPVQPSIPKVTKAAAASAVKPAPPTTPGKSREVLGPRGIVHQVAHSPELAYFLLPGHSRAILVWRIEFDNYREAAHKYRYGDSQVVLDAATGQRLAPWLAR
jgi:hypothetical protein